MTKLSSEKRDAIPEREFAFTKQKKEPLEDASHVRNALARFDQVEGVTDAERDAAWKKIQAAAKKFGVEINEKDWRELGQRNRRNH
ncbi:MAG: hypothetical protein H7244_02305 [Herminiimonas sp.]|nr:hypothetical protein [Herminiimonas sp.]